VLRMASLTMAVLGGRDGGETMVAGLLLLGPAVAVLLGAGMGDVAGTVSWSVSSASDSKSEPDSLSVKYVSYDVLPG